MSDDAFTQRLRTLIGRECCYYGRPCRVVEVLPASDSAAGHLVLEARDGLPPIQTDQYGQAAYRANEHLEVPLSDPNGNLSEELMHVLDSLNG